MLLNKLTNPLEQCQLKFQQQGDVSAETDRIFDGYASVFGGVDSYNDTIMKGAFEETLKDRKRPVRMFFGHSPARPLGKWLELAEDETGLYCRGELTPNNTDVGNIYASMKHGAIDGLSIGFTIPKGGSEEIEGGGRRISQINLVEISVVTMPADGNAVIHAVKSIADEIKSIETIRDAEWFLREAGSFPRSMAKAFISQLNSLYLREAEGERERIEAQNEAKEWLQNLIDKQIKGVQS